MGKNPKMDVVHDFPKEPENPREPEKPKVRQFLTFEGSVKCVRCAKITGMVITFLDGALYLERDWTTGIYAPNPEKPQDKVYGPLCPVCQGC
jgi:hypothetical protein